MLQSFACKAVYKISSYATVYHQKGQLGNENAVLNFVGRQHFGNSSVDAFRV